MGSAILENHSDVGVFVGNSLAFSDVLLRQCATEFPFAQFIRLPALADVFNLPKEQTAHCCIILVDEAQAGELIEASDAVFERFDRVRVALTYREPAIARNFLRQTADHPSLDKIAVLPMRLEIDQWIAVLRLIMGGQQYVPYELFQTNREQPAPVVPTPSPPRKSKIAQLTDREKQVLTFVSEGKQNKIIAAELDLSEHTVKLHIHNVISKLGVNNRTEAAVLYLADQTNPTGWTQ